MRRALICVLCPILLAGCSLKSHDREAQMRVAHFHALLNGGNFDQIAAETGPAMTWPKRGPAFKDYLAAIHRKLGFCGVWRQTSYVEMMSSRGRTAQLHADTHCDRDEAQETFVLDPAAGMRITGYAITSAVLVTS